MSVPENPPNTNSAPTVLGQNFTAREAKSLNDLRAHFRPETPADQAELDPRLEFARWLIAQGKLTDAR